MNIKIGNRQSNIYSKPTSSHDADGSLKDEVEPDEIPLNYKFVK